MLEGTERVLNVVLTVAALAIAASMVKREYFGSAGLGAETTEAAPLQMPDHTWRQLLDVGHRSGDSAAPIQVVVFSDFECPACAAFDRGVLAEAQTEFGDSLAVTILHFPLPFHRFAGLAAIASECAAARGRFQAYTAALYAFQDSLGLKSWWSIAAGVGLSDSAAFDGCLSDPSVRERVAEETRLGKELNIGGTPTVIVNGLHFQTPPSLGAIRKALAQG